jgi:hypothetical protein
MGMIHAQIPCFGTDFNVPPPPDQAPERDLLSFNLAVRK